MVETAHSLGVKVAVHASTSSAVGTVVDLGVDSLEHGTFINDQDLFKQMAKKGVIWNPTLSAYYTIGSEWWTHGSEAVRISLQTFICSTSTYLTEPPQFKLGLKNGVTIACGGDTGVFQHGDNSLEMRLMVKLGAEPVKVLRWATLGGWECLRSLEWEGLAGEERLKRA